MRGRDAPSVTKLHSSTLLTLILGNPSTPALSQEIVNPLPNPVSTPPPAQVPPPPVPTPPGADVASQLQGNTQPARDEDVPMYSQMAERASSPRMEDVASSQDIQGGVADADGEDEDDPSSARHDHPAQKESGPDGSSFTHMPLSIFSPRFLPPSPFLHTLSSHSQIQSITISTPPLFAQVRPSSISFSLTFPLLT
jgi:hypothetical protein